MSFGVVESDVSVGEQEIAFGTYRVFPARRLLLDGDQPFPLGSRAIEILLTLLHHRGDIVSKEVLIAHSDEISRCFRSKPAACSERSQPGIPMIPAEWTALFASG